MSNRACTFPRRRDAQRGSEQRAGPRAWAGLASSHRHAHFMPEARPGRQGQSSLCHAPIFQEVNHGVACGDTGVSGCHPASVAHGCARGSGTCLSPPLPAALPPPLFHAGCHAGCSDPLGLAPEGGLESTPASLQASPPVAAGSAFGASAARRGPEGSSGW